jgi:tRNA-dihydrouridine synthase C
VKFGPTFWQEFWHGSQDRIVLAPMEGVVDPVVRDLFTRIGGIDLCVTEFIRITDRVLPKTDFYRYCPELLHGGTTRAGVPVLVQLLGGQPAPMAESAAFAAELGAPGVDLNFGCPAKTVNRHDGGAALLKDPRRVHDVLQAVRRAVPVETPVSAKVRLGFSDKEFHLDIARAAESGGASWLAVHARTRDEGYKPPAHWEFIARMREAVKIPVIANGEIWNENDFDRARSASGCRHVMIGRGLMSYPDLARVLKNRASVAPVAWTEVQAWIQEFAHLSREHRHEGYAVSRLKQWTKSLSRQFTDAVEVFDEIKRFENLESMLARVSRVQNTAAHSAHI